MSSDFIEAPPHQTARPPPGLRAGVIVLLALTLSWGLYVWLPFDVATRKGLCLLVFIGILWLTEALHLAVTALLVPMGALLLGFPGLGTTQAFAPFADPIVFLFLGGFTMATALRVQQLDRKMAVAVLALSRGHLGKAVFLLFAVTVVLSQGISNTATAALMLPLALGLLSPLDPRRDQRTYAFVLLGVAYAASIGGIGTLVGSPPNAIAARAADIDFVEWLGIGMPLMLVLLPFMVLTLWLLLRPNLNRQVQIVMDDVPWTAGRRLTLLVFGLTALGLMVGAPP